MYHPQLDIFIEVVNSGSFAKCAEKLFLSSTAVMKQMNHLESRIGVKLLHRTHHGIFLTTAGEQFYKEATNLIQYSKKALQRVRQAANEGKYVINVGTSVLNPCKILMDMWGKVDDIYSSFQINIIPFEDNHRNILTVIGEIGKTYDVIVGACDAPQWLSKCSFYKLGEYRECIAVPKTHPLAAKKSLKLSDLYGETVYMVGRGISTVLDRLHDELDQHHPQIHIENTSYYDIDVFNQCIQNGGLMLTLDAWKDVHPSLTTIMVDWDYTIPYGILYPLTPSEGVKSFLRAIISQR